MNIPINPPSNRTVLILFLLTGLLFFSGCAPASNKFQEYSRTEMLMGTFVEVKLLIPREFTKTAPKIMNGVFRVAKRLEKKFSAFDPHSEVSVLNITKKKRVSSELFFLVSESQKAGELTNGEFDITVAPVLKKKGFYSDMPPGLSNAIPDNLNGIGWGNVTLDKANRTIYLARDTWIDLSGIASGYIVDRMALFLRKKGINSFLINDGGDIFCGRKEPRGVWRIGVKKPLMREIVAVIGVQNKAVVTSGDYENVVADKTTGKNISHIIKPGEAEAKEELPSSITVIAPTCILADALSTGMMAMGIDKAIELAEKLEDVEIITVERVKGEYIVRFSQGAEKYVVK